MRDSESPAILSPCRLRQAWPGVVEAVNLSRALKGQTQSQGAWGEMILETILTKSGLREGEEYTQQASTTDADGRRLRPDVVVHLPDGEKVIVPRANVEILEI